MDEQPGAERNLLAGAAPGGLASLPGGIDEKELSGDLARLRSCGPYVYLSEGGAAQDGAGQQEGELEPRLRLARAAGCWRHHAIFARSLLPAAAGLQSGGEPDSYEAVWSLTDESLIAGMASNDEACMVAFVRRYQARVYGLAFTILGDRGAAEEVAQEAFLRAWKHAGAFDARRAGAVTWLLSITRNLAIDAVRARRQRPFDPDAVAALLMSSAGSVAVEGPGESGPQVDEILRLRNALRNLPPEQQRAVVMASLYGRSAREVAEIEDIPLGTAKTRIRSALIKLRAELGVSRG